jgi:hypothetical protein
MPKCYEVVVPHQISKSVKVEEFRDRPGVAQRVPGGLDSQIS